MANILNTAEGGSNGTGITTGNTGGASGTAFTTISAGAGGTITFSNTQAAHGSLSYAFTSANGVTCYVLWTHGSTGAQFTFRFYLYLTGSPSGNTILTTVQNNPGGAAVCQLLLNSSRQILVQNAAGATQATFTNAVPLNTWTRIAFFGTQNATTGTINTAMYPGDSGTATETSNLTSQNTGSSVAWRVVFGKFSATNEAVFYIDDLAFDTQSSTEIGSAGVQGNPRPVLVASRVAVNRSRSY